MREIFPSFNRPIRRHDSAKGKTGWDWTCCPCCDGSGYRITHCRKKPARMSHFRWMTYEAGYAKYLLTECEACEGSGVVRM